jgi:hypothetical protein
MIQPRGQDLRDRVEADDARGGVERGCILLYLAGGGCGGRRTDRLR